MENQETVLHPSIGYMTKRKGKLHGTRRCTSCVVYWQNFSGVVALENVDFTLRKGEIHALMGKMVQENPP